MKYPVVRSCCSGYCFTLFFLYKDSMTSRALTWAITQWPTSGKSLSPCQNLHTSTSTTCLFRTCRTKPCLEPLSSPTLTSATISFVTWSLSQAPRSYPPSTWLVQLTSFNGTNLDMQNCERVKVSHDIITWKPEWEMYVFILARKWSYR